MPQAAAGARDELFTHTFVRSGILEQAYDEPYDLTSMGPMPGKYRFTERGEEMRMRFFDVYDQAIQHRELFLAERAPADRRAMIVPVFDIDIVCPASATLTPEQARSNHLYTKHFKFAVRTFLVDCLKSMFDVEAKLLPNGLPSTAEIDHYLCVFTEKPHFERDEEKCLLKDGLHIHFLNHPMTQGDYVAFTKRMVEVAEEKFTDAPPNCKVIFDRIANSPKVLVGSKKRASAPGHPVQTYEYRGAVPAEVTQAKRARGEPVERVCAIDGLGRICGQDLQLTARHFSTIARESQYTDYRLYFKQASPAPEFAPSELPSDETLITKARCALLTFGDTYHRLDVAVATERPDWLRIMFMLKQYGSESGYENTAYELFDKFSAMAPNYNQKKCLKEWRSAKVRSQGQPVVRIGTYLRYLLKSTDTAFEYCTRRRFEELSGEFRQEPFVIKRKLGTQPLGKLLIQILGQRISIYDSGKKNTTSIWRLFVERNDDLLREIPNYEHPCFSPTWTAKWIVLEERFKLALVENLLRIFIENLDEQQREHKDLIVAYMQNHLNICAMVTIITNTIGSPVVLFDTADTRVSFANGTISPSGKLEPHCVEVKVTNHCGYDLDLNYKPENDTQNLEGTFFDFFNTFFPEKQIGSLLPPRKPKYVIDERLTPLANEALMVIFGILCAAKKGFVLMTGEGDTGKTRFALWMLTSLLGPLYETMDKDKLLEQPKSSRNNHDEGLMGLVGKLVVNFSEMSAKEKVATATVKKLSGKEKLRLRAIYQALMDSAIVEPTWTMIVSTNEFPAQDDPAMLNRIVVLPFLHVFRTEVSETYFTDKLTAIRTVFWHTFVKHMAVPEFREQCEVIGFNAASNYPLMHRATEKWKRETNNAYNFVTTNVRAMPGRKTKFCDVLSSYYDFLGIMKATPGATDRDLLVKYIKAIPKVTIETRGADKVEYLVGAVMQNENHPYKYVNSRLERVNGVKVTLEQVCEDYLRWREELPSSRKRNGRLRKRTEIEIDQDLEDLVRILACLDFDVRAGRNGGTPIVLNAKIPGDERAEPITPDDLAEDSDEEMEEDDESESDDEEEGQVDS